MLDMKFLKSFLDPINEKMKTHDAEEVLLFAVSGISSLVSACADTRKDAEELILKASQHGIEAGTEFKHIWKEE